MKFPLSFSTLARSSAAGIIFCLEIDFFQSHFNHASAAAAAVAAAAAAAAASVASAAVTAAAVPEGLENTALK